MFSCVYPKSDQWFFIEILPVVGVDEYIIYIKVHNLQLTTEYGQKIDKTLPTR